MMKHGANIYKYAKKLGCKPTGIIDFSSNINSYHPNTIITPTNEMLVRYGDSSYKSLKQIIAKNYQIKKTQIALYNGATTAIYELIKSLNASRICLYAPLYGEYEKALRSGDKIVKINRFKELYKRPKKGSLVIFVNPSTPDGKYYDLERLFTIWREQKCTIILDESFLAFENLDSLRTQINNYEKLYIIQSFTKFYSCGGVRIGAVFSNKANIERLKSPLWNLSSFDVAFLKQRLEDREFKAKTLSLHQGYKKELKKILKESKLFSKIYKSDSNFFLVKSKKSKEIFKHLLKSKILVRTCGSFDFLSDDYLRFAVKDTKAHSKLNKALKQFC